MAELGVKDLFVLGRVSREPAYGHQIMQTIKTSRADLWVELSEKHVYYVLRKLAERGLVTEGKASDKTPSRNEYEITEPGRRELARLLQRDDLIGSVAYAEFDVVLAMLGYSDVLDDVTRTGVLRKRLSELERRLEDEYAPLMGKHVEKRFGATARALYDKGRMLASAERAWLVDLIEEVEREGWGGFAVREDEAR